MGGEPLSSLCQDSVSLICFNYTAFVLHQLFVITGGKRDKHNFVAAKHLSRQAYLMFVATKLLPFCRGKHIFVATKDVFCRVFVATKMILVETPVNDSSQADRRIKDCLTDESAQTLIHC